MKKHIATRIGCSFTLVALISSAAAAPLGTAFTYQGRLTTGTNAANGSYDLVFAIYDAPSSGSLMAGPLTNAVAVSNGLFTVALDFGGGAFAGADRWLEIGVRTNGADSDFAILDPRQPITPAPYALHAASAAGLLSLVNAPLDLTVNGQRGLRLEPATNGGPNVIGGWSNNFVAPGVGGATIGGGGGGFLFEDEGDLWYYDCTNRVEAGLGTVAGGGKNTSSGWGATVGGGEGNTSSGGHATVAGGVANSSSGYYATVGGGTANTSSGGWGATVGGGGYNTNSGNYATVGGGFCNMSSNWYATVPGGFRNTAGGQSSLAAGRRAQALHDGAFVWGDSTDAEVTSTNANSWTVRAGGGVRFFSDTNAAVGVQLAAGGNAWSALSDRGAKQNFKTVDPRAVLEKVSRLPVTEWTLISQPGGIRHIGPMAQDFQAAFGVGEDDRHISTSDADGVALAAIQGLNQKLEEEAKTKDARILALEQDVAQLKAALQRLAP